MAEMPMKDRGSDVSKPVVLTVAGFDPSAGAGVLADIKTVSFFGCYGVAATTSITFQNTQGVLGGRNQSRQTVLDQIRPLLQDFPISAMKTGMLPTVGSVQAVVEAISEGRIKNIVVDPVLRSSSGFSLVKDAISLIVSDLFPSATLITPNVAEASALSGVAVIDEHTMTLAARRLREMGADAVLVKGGDLAGDEALDILVDSAGTVRLTAERIQSDQTHGTGCTLASAIASLLARGVALREAVHIAKRYVAAAIRTAPRLGHGHGPLNHFPPEFDIEK
jgi:hydroxymethylpyrimidine/phosphomethylpyrimidine kinase